MDPAEDNGSRVPVPPSSATGAYTDSALTNLFSAQLANINAGKQLIWQRYHAMLAANAALLTIVINRVPSTLFHATGYCLFGILLCTAWWSLTSRAWSHNIRYIQIAKRFMWNIPENFEEINPLADDYFEYLKDDWDKIGWRRDGIFRGAMSIIALCALGHVLLLWGRV